MFSRTSIEIPTSVAWLFLLFSLSLAGVAYYFASHQGEIAVTLDRPDAPGSSFVYGALPELSRGDFFAEAREGLLAAGGRFVEADLEALVLRVHENGEQLLEVPIVAKGKRGSWWETPAGLYKVELKEREHFSSIGHVYMPWSMQFQGNFFIHGIPRYADGGDVSSSYSGGCIRLNTKDAERVYALVSRNTPVLVFAGSGDDRFAHAVRRPQISASRYLVADIKNNFVFLEKGSRDEVGMGDLSKLLAGLVATEYINLDRSIEFASGMAASTSVPRLAIGNRYTAYQLLFPLLRESSNEALAALSRFIGGGTFRDSMNQRAVSLGMNRTRVADLEGDESVSTPEDMFVLTKYLYENRSFVWGVTSGKLSNGAYSGGWLEALPVPLGFDGLGSLVGVFVAPADTAAASAISVFDLPFRGEKRPLAILLFDTVNPREDTAAVLSYVQDVYR